MKITYVDDNCFECDHNELFYGVGTVLKIKNNAGGANIVELVKIKNGIILCMYDMDTIRPHTLVQNDYCDRVYEIISPVYMPRPLNFIRPQRGVCYVDTSIGWLWYIIIMIIGTIFIDRILIWISATIIFFVWKKEKENGGRTK